MTHTGAENKPEWIPSPQNNHRKNIQTAHFGPLENSRGENSQACCRLHSHRARLEVEKLRGEDTRAVHYNIRSSPDIIPDRSHSENTQAGVHFRTHSPAMKQKGLENSFSENLRDAHRVSSLVSSPMIHHKNRLSISPETSDYYSPPKQPFVPEFPSGPNSMNLHGSCSSSQIDRYGGKKCQNQRRDSHKHMKTLAEHEIPESSESSSSSSTQNEIRHKNKHADKVEFDFANPEAPRRKAVKADHQQQT